MKGAESSVLDQATPRNGTSVGLDPTASSSSVATKGVKTSPQWIAYSTAINQSWSTHDVAKKSADPPPAEIFDLISNPSPHSIPGALKQNAQETSLCFFFAHYGGTSIDPEARNGFNQLWKPMYEQSSAQSSLRLATAAVAVNIATMWSSQGFDTRLARSLFAEAVAAARENLHNPLQSSTDGILMTILIFDLYDALVLHYAPSPVDYGKHKHGALAIIEHRGCASFATSQGRALIAAVRHSLLPYMLSFRKPFPERSDYLFDHPSINDTKASSLDLISVRLSRIQSRLWTLHLERRLEMNSAERRACYEEIIAEAVKVENFLLDWKESITGPDWLPEHVLRASMMESILAAGFYGTRCSVWVDLTIGATWISYYIRYLLTLQVIRQSFADEGSLLNDPTQRALLSKTNERVQDLADCICESIPFVLGDTVIPKNPMYSTSINFPHHIKFDPKTGMPMRTPSLQSNHQKQAGASGGWILFPQLVNVWRLAEPEDDAVPIILREGQLDWIKAQVKRLQNIFLFCEPVWFKRVAPCAAQGNIDRHHC